MGGSVRPRSGPNWVVVGDAAGSVNPWNGDGVGPALVTGRLAAEAIGRALDTDDGLELQRYEAALTARWQRYHHLGRLATRTLGRRGLMRQFTQLAIRSPGMGELVTRVSTDLLDSQNSPTVAPPHLPSSLQHSPPLARPPLKRPRPERSIQRDLFTAVGQSVPTGFRRHVVGCVPERDIVVGVRLGGVRLALQCYRGGRTLLVGLSRKLLGAQM